MKSLLLAALLSLIPGNSHAGVATYQCSISADNGIGVGVEVVLELLSEKEANVSIYHTGNGGEKVPPVLLVNPGQVSRVGNVLHFSSEVEGSGVERGRTGFSLDLSSMQLYLDPAGGGSARELSLPCKEQAGS